MDPDDRAISLAARIADGSAIDWPEAESTAGSGDRALLDELRVISGVASVHRAPTNVAGETLELATWGPLTVLSSVGEGRFGDVYVAWDARLHRRVALKLLRAPSGSLASPSRAIEEARLLARVRHSNVLTVFGAECFADQVGIWTEFIEGQTLAHVLAERGPLDPDEVSAIGVSLAQALTAVHDAGLLHRDVKPQNVMRETGGRIVLMDFGAGHDLVLAPAKDGDLTGTPLYLAPEVLHGGAASQASDVYALGVLLFHLLTGSHPVSGTTLEDVRRAHGSGTRRSLREVGTVHRRLQGVVDRAISPNPQQRYQSARELESALVSSQTAARAPNRRWVVASLSAAALALVAALMLWITGLRSDPIVPFEARDSILIAAFANNTGESRLDGVAEAALQYELVNSRFVNVVPQDRVDRLLSLMRKPVETRLDITVALEVAVRDGGIKVVLGGELEKAGDAYSIRAQLFAPGDRRLVGNLEERATTSQDIQPAMRRLASKFREALGEARWEITASNARLEKVTTPSLEALTLYSQAYALGPRDQWAASDELVRRALEIDPTFASAQIWLAWCMLHTSPGRYTPEVEAVAATAVELARTTTDWERFWIESSALIMTNEPAKRLEAVPKLIALLELVPTHYWGLNNLMVSMRPHRIRDALPYILTAAKLQPTDFAATVRAFGILQETGDLKQAQTYSDRARALAEANETPLPAIILQFPVRAAYQKSDMAWTVLELDRLAFALTGISDDRRFSLFTFVSQWNLALGRPGEAVSLMGAIGPPDAREFHLASAAFFRDDQPAVLEHMARVRLRDRTGQDASQGWGLSRIEAWYYLLKTGGAARVVREYPVAFPIQSYSGLSPADQGIHDTFRGCLSVEQGEFDHALALLEMARKKRGGPLPYWFDCAAEAWVRKGQIGEAIKVFESAAPFFPQPNPFRTRDLVRLAELYHADRRKESARQLLDHLGQLLSKAEPGLPLIERLSRLRQDLGPSIGFDRSNKQ